MGTTLDKTGNLAKEESQNWQKVYVAMRCRNNEGIFSSTSMHHPSSNLGFVSAGFCTHWLDGSTARGKSFRYAPFPVTPFRAELAAIEEALKEVTF